MDIEKYLYGSCHLFALALHKELGYQMIFFWDNERIDEDWEVIGRSLVHAFCETEKAGLMVDARGVLTMEEIEADYDWNVPSIENYNIEHLYKDMEEGVLHKPVKNEIKRLQDYIRKNVSKYS